MSSLDRIKKKRQQLSVENNKSYSSADKSIGRINMLRDEIKTTGKIDYGDIAPINLDNPYSSKWSKKAYANSERDSLLAKQKELQEKLKNYDRKENPDRQWWEDDKNVFENLISLPVKAFSPEFSKSKYLEDPEYDKLVKEYDAVNKAVEDNYAATKKYDDGIMGYIEKAADVFTGNASSGFKGVESTAKKILGTAFNKEVETDTDLTLQEKISQRVMSESQGVEKVSYEVVGSIGRMLPQFMSGDPGIATAIGFANFGGGAYNQAKREGYSEEEATKYGLAIGSLEMATSKALGTFSSVYGKSKMGNASQEVIDKVIPRIIKNKQVRNVLGQFAAEGSEEFLQEYIEGIARDTLLDDKGFLKSTWTNITDPDKFADALYSGLIGGITGSTMAIPSQIDAYKYEKATGRDAETGLTANEQKVVDSEVAKRTEGKNLTKKQIAKIETEVKNELEKGYISTDTIESVLGGDTYNNLKSTRDNKTKIENEIKELEGKKNAEITVKEMEHLKDLREQLKGIDTNTLETDLQGKMGQIIKADDYLQRSYQEKAKRGQKFTYDASKVTNEFEKAALESASKVMNDTNRSHEFVEPVVKLAKDKGTYYEFTNNAELEKSNYDVKGKQVNGLVTVEKDGKKKILINIDSSKALNTIVGHETTHLLEGTTEYQELQDAIFNYAKTKGDFDSRQAILTELYKNIKGADVNGELTADLVGDYLFTDNNFINELSTQKPTVFQKVKELIDDLVVRFKGTKEEKALREVQKKFKEAYRQSNTQTNADTQYSMAGKKAVDRLVKNDSSYQYVIDNYNEALKMKEEGKTNREIWQKTLWIQDEEGKWKIEVSDRDARLDTKAEKNKKYKLKDVLKHEKLYEIYPETKNITVKFKNIKDNVDPDTGKHRMIAGYYNALTGTISVNNKLLEMTNGDKHIINTILHEVQHKIQKYEGFNYGYKGSDEAGYFNNLGEREAKDTERRRTLSYKERGQIAPVSLFEENSNSLYNNANGGNRSEVNQKNKTILSKSLYATNERSIDDRRGNRADVEEIENPYYIDEELDNSSFFNTQYSLTDNQGRTLTKEQQEYFKDSKVRDENGNLLTVYHGSYEKGFSVFDKKFLGSSTNAKSAKLGFFFTDNQKLAKQYANRSASGQLFETYLDIKNPLIKDFNGEQVNADKELTKLIKQAKENGNDGVIALNLKDGWQTDNQYIVFNSNQIKNIDNTNPTTDADIRYSLSDTNLKQKQLDIVLENNPVEDDYHTWIRSIDDIKTYQEAIQEDLDGEIQDLTPDFKKADLEKTLETGKITVYSSYPIEQGIFVTPSKMEAQSYAGSNKVYSKEVNLKDIAWIDTLQGQYAKVEDAGYSLSQQGEQAAPTGDYNVYGEDVKYQEAIALVRDEYAPLTEEDLPYLEQQYNEAPKEDIAPPETEENIPVVEDEITSTKSLFETRNYEEVGNRKVNAYQYDNPEVKPYFQEAARGMIDDLAYSLKGQRFYNDQVYYDTNGEQGFFGINRFTANDIAELLDGVDGKYKLSYKDIEQGLKAIVEDHGAENNAASKRIEFYLDKRLREGFTTLDGVEIPANQEYLELLEAIETTDYYNSIPIGEAPVQSALNPNVRESNVPIKEIKVNDSGQGADSTDKNTAKQLTIDGKEEDLVTKTKKELRKALLGTEAQKEFITNALDNAKNRSMALMNNTDTIRNTELVFGRDAGNVINEVVFQKEIDNEADSIAWQNKERQEIKDLGIKARSKESAAVQKYGEKQYVNEYNEVVAYGDVELAKEFSDVATQEKIKNAAKVIRSKYDAYIDEANNVLAKLGFEPIKKRNDYMKHFQELNDVFSRHGIPFNAQNMAEHTLPTDINGLTEFWSPQKNYFANMQPRKGMKTTYDAITGVDGYIGGIANLIYHTEDIQRGRAFEELIRETYGEDKGWDNLENLPEELQQARMEKIQDNHLSNYAAWVHEWTNNVAGKKNKIDRSVEAMFGRKAFAVLDEVRKQVGSNMIGLNLSSSLTNLIAPVQAASKTNKLAVLKGTADTIKNMFVKDNFMDNNKFLTARMGTDMLSQNAWQKMQNAGFVFMKGMDWFSSNQIVRSKYYELRAKGMNEAQAHSEAGKFAARILGDRTKGANAQLYNSKLVGLVTQFQLEVNNQLYSQFYDTYHESKEAAQGNALKTAAGMTFTLGQLFALTHLFGQTFEAIAGYNPTFDVVEMLKTAFGWGDDEEEEKPLSERLKSAVDQLVDALPYVNILTSGGRIPVASGIPNLVGVATGGKDQYGNELTLEDEMKKLLYLIPPTGGNQFKKTTQGLAMFDEDLPVTASYTNSGNLRFPVEDTLGNRVQAAIFGQWANKNASDYFDNERQPLKEKQIQEYADLDMPIKDYWKYREGLKEQSTIEEKFEYINGLDVTDEQKNIMINNATGRENPIDMSGYDSFGSYDEFDYATKNPDKYRVIEQIDTFDNYNSYKEDIASIKEQFSEDNGYSTKDRKAAVQQYINSLSLDIPQKIILEKMAGGYSIKDYENYMFSYIQSLPMTAEEKQAMHKQLFD